MTFKYLKKTLTFEFMNFALRSVALPRRAAYLAALMAGMLVAAVVWGLVLFEDRPKLSRGRDRRGWNP